MRRARSAHVRAPDSRAHKTLALATAGLLTVGAGMTMMVMGGAASADQPADPPGNNGFVMIDGVDVDSPGNVPHVDCEFRVQWFNFDAGDIYSQVTFELQAPTAGAGYSLTPSSDSVFVGEDAATGGGDLDADETYRLLFTGDPQSKQGFHVKLTVNTPGSVGNDSKSKVFWVEPCQVEPSPSPTPTEEPSPSPTPTEEPSPSPTPTEEPSPSPTPTEEPSPSPTPTEEPTEKPTDQPTVLPTEAETSAPTEEGRTPKTEPEVLGAEESLPSGVDAGLVTQQPANATWGAGVAGAGLVMMAAAGAMNLRGRRRGEHQI